MNKEAFKEYVLYDVFSDIPEIETRPLFGGYGFYLEGKICAAYMKSEHSPAGLYLKASGNFADMLLTHGSEQFLYSKKTRKEPYALGYYYVPEEYLEQRELMKEWLYRAWEISSTLIT